RRLPSEAILPESVAVVKWQRLAGALNTMARRWIRADDRPRRRASDIITGERREARAGRLAEDIQRARGRLVLVVATITRVLTGAFLAGGDGLPLARADPRAGRPSSRAHRGGHRRHLRQPRRSKGP